MAKRKELSQEDKAIWALNKLVSNNLKSLLKAEGLKYTEVIEALQDRYGYGITASYFNKMLNHPNQYKIPLIFLLQCSEYFNISIDTLLRENISVYERKDPDSSSAVTLDKLVSKYEESQRSFQNNYDSSPSESAFVTNPNSILFRSVLQPYYCYFYPTASKENKTIDSVLQGTLEFKKDNNQCKVIFNIEPNKKDKTDRPIRKQYEGYAIISTSVSNLYCILKSEDIGEYCFLIFRHFHFNYELQDCHLAELLSTSSATKERYPTVLRIFLSKEKIKTEHIPLLAPHLWLNYSKIAITESNLSELIENCEQYKRIGEEIVKRADSDNVLFIKEKDATAIARNHLDKEEALKFITDLRSKSYAYHYNKVSDTANDNIHDLLVSLGYYQKH